MRSLILCLALCLSPGLAPVGLAEEVVLPSVRDNTLIERPMGDRSAGSSENIFAGRNSQMSDYLRRGLMAFDFSSIPADAVVTDVTLEVTVTQTSAGPEDVALHRVLADWGEAGSFGTGGGGGPAEVGDATWLHTVYDTEFWSNPGGDYEPVASDSQVLDQPAVYTFGSAGLVTDVQGWVDGTLPNHGWMFVGDELTVQSSKRIGSRENTVAADRPRLRVVYELPPFTRGDCNDDGLTDIADLVFGLEALFVTPGDVVCVDACDANDDGLFDVADAIYTGNALFTGGTPLPAPASCGTDPSDDGLGCEDFSSCP